MQQYFSDVPLSVGTVYEFTKEQAHHAGTVLRMHDETIRLVHDGKGYFARVYTEGKRVYAIVEKEDDMVNELPVDVTLCMALIRREKMELVLQKAAELGVKRIIPFESSRCVVHERKEKKDKLMARWNTILLEASAQCKRNVVPVLSEVVPFSSIESFTGDVKMLAFENARYSGKKISDTIKGASSIMVVIGPEGGFSDAEAEYLIDRGYMAVTLGSRILRAETAALYACSVIGECCGE